MSADRAAYHTSQLALRMLRRAQSEAGFLTTRGFTADEAARIAAHALTRAAAEAGRDIRPPIAQP